MPDVDPLAAIVALMRHDVPVITLENYVRRPGWMARAACRGADTDLFFPSTGQHGDEARELCRTCPVRQECLDYAVADGELAGIWGGVGKSQRLTIAKAHRERVA